MGDLNVRFGSQRLGIIKGTNGEQTFKSNGKKNWQASAALPNLEIFQNRDIYKFMRQARNTKTVRDYKILKEEMQK